MLKIVSKVPTRMIILIRTAFLLIGRREVYLIHLVILNLNQSVQVLLELVVHCLEFAVVEVEDRLLPAMNNMIKQLLRNNGIFESRTIQRNQILLVFCHERGEVLEMASLLLRNIFRSSILFLLSRLEAEATQGKQLHDAGWEAKEIKGHVFVLVLA